MIRLPFDEKMEFSEFVELSKALHHLTEVLTFEKVFLLAVAGREDEDIFKESMMKKQQFVVLFNENLQS